MSNSLDIYYTQTVLSDVFALPSAAQMQKSAENYILTGEFLDLTSEFTQSLSALWGRSLYAGIGDGESDVDSSEDVKNISLSRYSEVYEFARKKDPQVKYLEGQLKNTQKWFVEAAAAGDLDEVDRLNSEIEILESELNRLKGGSKKKKKKKKKDDSKPKIRSVNSKRIEQAKPKEVSSNTDDSPDISSEEQRRRFVLSKIRRIRNSLDKDRINFDPSNVHEDPYQDLYEGASPKQAAVNRLKETSNLQVFATLNERYPSLGEGSIFAEKYLRTREATVAKALNKQHANLIKSKIAKYVETNPNIRSEQALIEELKNVYTSSKKDQFIPFINLLKGKQETLKVTSDEYLDYLNTLGNTSRNTELQELEKESAALQEESLDLDDRLYELKEADSLTRKQEEEKARIAQRINEIEETQNNLDRKRRQLQQKPGWLQKRVNAAVSAAEESPDAKKYIDPRKKVDLTRGQRRKLIKLLGLTPENSQKEIDLILNGDKSFTGKELSNYIERLKRKGGRFDEDVYQLASRTASTEVAAAYNVGRLQTYLSRGVKYVQWISTIDTRTSKFCWSLHRKIFPISDVLSSSLAKQSFPDTKLPEYHPKNQGLKNKLNISMIPPPAHPYCRSFLVPIYTNKEMDKYKDGLPPDTKLDKWLLDSFMERRGLLENLTDRQKEEVYEEIIKKQSDIRNKKTSILEGQIDSLHSMFNSGLSLLSSRLKKDGVADFTVDDIQKNDKALQTALLGGAAVLGVGSMMYFFMKSNLGSAITEYMKLKTTDALGGAVVGGLSSNAITRLIKKLVDSSKTVKNLPEATKALLPDATDLDLESLYSEVETSLNKGETALELASVGQSDRIQDIAPGNLTGVQLKAYLNSISRTALNEAVRRRRRAYDSSLELLKQALTNTGGAIDTADITFINEFANVYNIGRTGKPPTFVSKKVLDQLINDPNYRQEIDRIVQDIDELDRGLDGISTISDDNDELGQALLRKEKAEIAKVKATLESLKQKVLDRDFISQRQTDDNFQELLERNVDIQDLLERANNGETAFREVVDGLFSKFEELLPSEQLLYGFIPENVNDLNQLKSVKSVLKSSLAQIRKDFLSKNNAYTVPTAARKQSDELNNKVFEAMQEVENVTNRLQNQGYNYQPSTGEVQSFYRNRINDRVSELIKLQNRIETRIKELE